MDAWISPIGQEFLRKTLMPEIILKPKGIDNGKTKSP
jgi:hypothetical protein